MSRLQNSQTSQLLDCFVADNINFKQSQSSQCLSPDIAVELHEVYKQIVHKFEKANLNFREEIESKYTTESQYNKLSFIRMAVNFLFEKLDLRQISNDCSQQISCVDCRNYQSYLQKLENDIRQHIRLEQQLKLYQENLEEKLQQQKKQQQKMDHLVSKLKTSADQQKSRQNTLTQRINKLQQENERLKNDIRGKQNPIQYSQRTAREASQTKSTKPFQQLKQKQNIIAQKSGYKKEEKKEVRKSIQKRPQSSERFRCHVNSNKKIGNVQKLIDKNKQDRKKAIQTKFQLRR